LLTKELTESYKATTYRVPSLNLDIRIDEKNPLLDFILKNKNAETWAFITAWNPESRELSISENRDRNQDLLTQLKSEGFAIYKGIGIPDAGDWTPEESFFVPSISQKQALELAKEYGQNAIVFGAFEKKTVLLVLTSSLKS